MSKIFVMAAASAALLTAVCVACGPATTTPKATSPTAGEKPGETVVITKASVLAHQNDIGAIEAGTHNVVLQAPADYARRPCVYVAHFNTGATYDAAGLYGDGASYDAGKFAFLGYRGDLMQVAGPNNRADPAAPEGMYPLGKEEPHVVIMYFPKKSMTFTASRTEYVLNAGSVESQRESGIDCRT